MTDEQLVEALLAGQRRAVARLLTRVEDGSQERLREVIRRIHPHTGSAHVVGITGSPGVGKSTLTNALVEVWRGRGRRVAVLAVDPSSPFSGGALLGDRVRMQDHVLDEGVFIRSMASRGHLGGLSWATPQALLVLDAAGFEIIVVETVGVGQAEVEVASVADSTVVTLAPGMGDAVQAAKAGILEVADIFCVNKADRDGADRTVRELKEMQKLGDGAGEAGWTPPIVRTVAAGAVDSAADPGAAATADPGAAAADPTGVAGLADAIAQHWDWLTTTGRRDARKLDRARLQIRELALGTVRRRFATLGDGDVVHALAQRVAARELDPYRAADELLAEL